MIKFWIYSGRRADGFANRLDVGMKGRRNRGNSKASGPESLEGCSWH